MLVSLAIVVVLLLLLVGSALASASEIAFFSLSPTDIEHLNQSDSARDKTILAMREDPDKLLATILITNNIVNVAIVILSSTLLMRWFDFSDSPVLAFLVESVLITFVLLLLGENMPKIYASANALKFVRSVAYMLLFLEKIFSPFSWLLTRSLGRLQREHHSGQSLTMDELSQAFEITSDGIKEDKELLEGIINFGDINAASVMTPRVSVVAIEDTASYADVLRLINEAGYSRMPVYHETLDNIRGILYIKDLVRHLNQTEFNWQNLVRKAYFVPQTKHINLLLEDFQKNKTHIAVVVDEFGGTSGIVTMEDILEEIVGEIDDEYDGNDQLYARLGQHSYLLEAKILLNDFYKLEGIQKHDFEKLAVDVESLGGLLLQLNGEIPAVDTEIDYGRYHFQVVSSDKRRVKTVKLTINTEEGGENEK